MYNTLYIVNSGKRELRNVFNSSNRESQQRKQHTPAKQYLSLPLPCALAGRQACKRVTSPPQHVKGRIVLHYFRFVVHSLAPQWPLD